ncbi:neurogenic locus notch homolog protein 3-like [Littorina saxatilis]|uniref:neurogenic locus notch homolog protein 3-like n=1 Tax=Littorina saxatilis TaxID=31220 RepID=UPI0038B5F310
MANTTATTSRIMYAKPCDITTSATTAAATTASSLHIEDVNKGGYNTSNNSDSSADGFDTQNVSTAVFNTTHLSNSRTTALRRVQHAQKLHHPLSLWPLLLLLHVASSRGAVASILSMACSSVCSHGTCSYPVTHGNKPTVVCHCHPGWGGEQCSIPCTRNCGHGQCVSVRDSQVCLCQLGFVGVDCSQPGYDVVTLLSLARFMSTGPPILHAAPLRANTAGQGTGEAQGSVPSAVELKASVQGLGHSLQAVLLPSTGPKPRAAGDSLVPTELKPNLSDAVVNSVPAADLKPDLGSLTNLASSGQDSGLVGAMIPLVDNPREHVARNVEQGSNQCMQNFVCRHGGRCVTGHFGGFRCRCKPPFFGTFCENSCPKTCQNGGSCVRVRHVSSSVSPSSVTVALAVSGYSFVYRCACPRQFTGEQCEKAVNS